MQSAHNMPQMFQYGSDLSASLTVSPDENKVNKVLYHYTTISLNSFLRISKARIQQCRF